MRKALRVADVGVQEMADYLEVSRGAVGNWINGKAKPSPQSVRLWALRTGVPYEWLRDGESPRQGGPDGGNGLLRLDSNQRPSD
ncbi:helix-turn-helix domain-containing protein [Luteimicrobium sp. NPDC057192]|uniref:helix-turn-helix domain-containing protein n=1 Tax=Luteimicrobium sp. NPDC057192 TaxID=3346042 RepID=UPI0036266BC2